MKDVNLILRKAYISALSTVGCPVFWGEAPDDTNDAVYIVLSAITNNDSGDFDKSATGTTIQLKIHSWVNKYNPGTATPNIAENVFAALYPTQAFNLDASAEGVQIINTTIFSDTDNDIGSLGGRKYSDRTIIFSHKIIIL